MIIEQGGDDECDPKWIEFYRTYIQDVAQAEDFVRRCELRRPPRHPSRLIMHQCVRLVETARDIGTVRPAYQSLQVLLLTICAEAVAKLQTGAPERGRSRFHTVRFFTELLPTDRQERLVATVRSRRGESLTINQVADALYEVRCDAAHEGQLWSIWLSESGNPTMSAGWDLTVTLRLEELYEIVVAGCVAAATDLLDKEMEVPR